jgi:hypothetical protein
MTVQELKQMLLKPGCRKANVALARELMCAKIIRANEATAKKLLYANKTHRPSPRPQPQRPVSGRTDGKIPGKEGNPTRAVVVITSFRERLIDPDNLCPKYFIDGLRYAQLLPGDSAREIDLVLRQTACEKGQDRTEILITWPES